MKIKFIIFIVYCCSFVSCQSEINVQDYYFKLEEFKISKTYKFESKNDKKKVEYWRIKSDINRKELLTRRFNERDEMIDSLTEKITSNYSKLLSYSKSIPKARYFFIKFYIKQGEIINWNPNKEAIYSGEFIDTDIIYQLSRKRKFVGFETIEVLSDEVEVVKFKDVYTFENLNRGKNSKKQWYEQKDLDDFTQYSFFAKNIGLVKYIKEYPDGEQEIMELTEIIPLKKI